MTRRKRFVIFMGVVLVSVGIFFATAMGTQRGKRSSEFREQFIKSFQRTGLNTTVGDAMMLRILVESSEAKRGIEVGSFNGFGAINMGIGFERTGGHLYTLEIDPERVRECRENLKKVGLENTVTCIEGDALKTLPTLRGQFDYVFIDALKSDYLKYLKIIEPKLVPAPKSFTFVFRGAPTGKTRLAPATGTASPTQLSPLDQLLSVASPPSHTPTGTTVRTTSLPSPSW